MQLYVLYSLQSAFMCAISCSPHNNLTELEVFSYIVHLKKQIQNFESMLYSGSNSQSANTVDHLLYAHL